MCIPCKTGENQLLKLLPRNRSAALEFAGDSGQPQSGFLTACKKSTFRDGGGTMRPLMMIYSRSATPGTAPVLRRARGTEGSSSRAWGQRWPSAWTTPGCHKGPHQHPGEEEEEEASNRRAVWMGKIFPSSPLFGLAAWGETLLL